MCFLNFSRNRLHGARAKKCCTPSAPLTILFWFLNLESINLNLLGKWSFFNLMLDLILILWSLPLSLLTQVLLLQWKRSNMMPFIFALEANGLGQSFDLVLTLILVYLGIVLIVRVKYKSTLVIVGIDLHSTCCRVWISLRDAFPSLSSKK